ncbi:MAG TPA: PEGA domain-containing protein [Polyangia bacterium]|nr:PEGA domain-containing protein [Polyangia bacterium]
MSPPQIAWADSASDADAAISKGIDLRRQGKNEEALEQFQNAYRLSPSPRAKAQIALAEQAIGRWADAERDLADAMSQTSDPWIARQRTVLTEAMGVIRRHLGALTIKGDPAGAIVELDGEPVGTIPLPERHVTAGEVVVTVRAQGFVSVTRKVTVTPGELAAEVFRLKHIESDSAAGGLGSSRGQSEGVRAETPPPAVGLSSTPPDEPATSGGRGPLRTAAWGAGIGGGALLVAGGTFLLLAEHTVHRFDDHCFVDADTNAVRGGGDCSDLNDTVHRDRVIGVIGLAVGGAAIATSVLFFYKTASVDKSTKVQALAACAPTAGLGVACAWRF